MGARGRRGLGVALTMPGCGVQKYGKTPVRSKVWLNVPALCNGDRNPPSSPPLCRVPLTTSCRLWSSVQLHTTVSPRPIVSDVCAPNPHGTRCVIPPSDTPEHPPPPPPPGEETLIQRLVEALVWHGGA